MVKEWHAGEGWVDASCMSVPQGAPTLSHEIAIFQDTMAERGIAFADDGLPLALTTGSMEVPMRSSRYRDELAAQCYEIDIASTGIAIRGASDAGAFHGLMTLARMTGTTTSLPAGRIRDWPDLPLRMIMVDPARQNENFEYYRRVISVAARYGINAVLIHLTDDQTACLHHPDYPELMHPQAWTVEQCHALEEFARRHHVQLIPEIESFGHSRMFTRRADYAEFLHGNMGTTNTESWMGTDKPGYTNVLCPASPMAIKYIDDMYAMAASAFSHPVLHLGFDEVDMTSCPRCIDSFPGVSRADWFRSHMLACRDLAAKHGRKAAFWGDMLIQYPEILDGLPTTGTIIYDWHYKPEVSPQSSREFSARGFEVVASPALMCAPHMVIPNAANFINIARFTTIARELDLHGVNATIWIPTRYMSDILWPGIAFAGAQAWGGSHWDQREFLTSFAADHFGIADGMAFMTAWTDLIQTAGARDEFFLCAWTDEAGLKKVKDASTTVALALLDKQMKMDDIEFRLNALGLQITRNAGDWAAIEQTAAMLSHLYRRFAAAREGTPDRTTIETLDRECLRIVGWIEDDWRRNRHPDDPNMDGLHLPHHHLLHQFKEMHRYQQALARRNPED